MKQDGKPWTPRPEELPPITQPGAGTFGCLLNGKVWLAEGGGMPNIIPQYYKRDFFISALKQSFNNSNQAVIDETILMDVKPIWDTGFYYVNSKNLFQGNGFLDGINHLSYTYNDNDSLKNWVHITKLDQKNLIISGTFNLFFTSSGKDTISITQGRFDARYDY